MSVRVHVTEWKAGSGPGARQPKPSWCPSPTMVALAVVGGWIPILLVLAVVVGWFQ